jgi:hypothetical protein
MRRPACACACVGCRGHVRERGGRGWVSRARACVRHACTGLECTCVGVEVACEGVTVTVVGEDMGENNVEVESANVK